jgi:tRNA pseudouridine13 synthase
LYGDGSSVSGVSAAHESWLAALTNARVKPANRSLRLRVADLNWTAADDSLVLDFALGRGAFATSVLREIASIANAT